MNEELRMKNEEFRPRNGMRSKEILHSSFFIINLFVLYYLCHELGFANYFFAYKHVTLHGGHAATDGGQQLYTEISVSPGTTFWRNFTPSIFMK